MGHPSYVVAVKFTMTAKISCHVHERARKGIFLSFQNPEEVPGLRVVDFIRAAQGEITGKMPSYFKFRRELQKEMENLHLGPEYADRYLNVGFSGGEKKKNEILQLNMLKPTLALLDETDSGLDVDAVKLVSEGIQSFQEENNAILIITHHRGLLEQISLDKVHVMVDGRLVKSGDRALFEEIQDKGFAWLADQDKAADDEAQEEAHEEASEKVETV